MSLRRCTPPRGASVRQAVKIVHLWFKAIRQPGPGKEWGASEEWRRTLSIRLATGSASGAVSPPSTASSLAVLNPGQHLSIRSHFLKTCYSHLRLLSAPSTWTFPTSICILPPTSHPCPSPPLWTPLAQGSATLAVWICSFLSFPCLQPPPPLRKGPGLFASLIH